MTNDATSREGEGAMRVRERALARRESWVGARETVAREREVLVQAREQALVAREEVLRDAETARRAAESLLMQMREANGMLVAATLRARDLAEHASEARAIAEQRASAASANEEALRLARDRERAKDDFLAMLGHELRNPLAAILMALELIAVDHRGVHEREHAIIERQVNHLVHLVEELLDTSRIQTGKITLERRPIELAEIVSRAVEMVAPLIASYRHALTVEVPRRGLAVEGDPLRLVQVVANLLTNAAKFTPSGGAITVTGEAREGTLVLRIRDTGIGISKEMLGRIFEPYAQDGQPGDRARTGLGLGLAIVRSLVAMHGGTVTARSDGLACGSELIVELPAIA